MMEVADAHKSVATIRTVVRGHEAHSALPALGANAVAAAADIVSEIGRLAREYEKGPLDPRFAPPYSTLHVGRDPWWDGAQHSRPRMRLRLGVPRPAGHVVGRAVAEVQAFVDTVALPRLTRFVSGPAIVTDIEAEAPALAAEPGSLAETLALRLTRSNRTIAVSFATESGHFQRAGIPDHRLRAGIDRSGAQARRICRGVAARGLPRVSRQSRRRAVAIARRGAAPHHASHGPSPIRFATRGRKRGAYAPQPKGGGGGSPEGWRRRLRLASRPSASDATAWSARPWRS